MANQTRDFPTENDLDILKLKTQLYAKVDQALDEVINRVNEHKSVTTQPTTELPNKSVKDILKDPDPIKPPTFDPHAVAKATELMKEAAEKEPIPDPFAGLTERMNIDKVSSEEVDKASEELLKAVAFEKRMAKHDGKKDKPDPLQEAATELSKAILNYTNAVKDSLVKELTTAFKHNSVNTRPNRDQLYGPGPVKSTKERALNLVASNILSDKGASKELLKLIQEAYAEQSQPLPELKEDDSHLTKATPSEISRFNQKQKLMAIAQDKLREAKSMVEAVNELYPEA